jgi:hypothetical protein
MKLLLTFTGLHGTISQDPGTLQQKYRLYNWSNSMKDQIVYGGAGIEQSV